MLSKDDELAPGEMRSPYSGFLINKLAMIYDAWDAGDLEHALARAVRLAYFLPRDIKMKLTLDVEAITEEMNATYGIQSFDFYNTQLQQNKAARRVARKWLPEFVDKMTDLLDEKGYLEKQSPRPKRPSKGRMGVPE